MCRLDYISRERRTEDCSIETSGANSELVEFAKTIILRMELYLTVDNIYFTITRGIVELLEDSNVL